MNAKKFVIKPCRFCNCKDAFVNSKGDFTKHWVQCHNCIAHGSWCDTEAEAVRSWNRSYDETRSYGDRTVNMGMAKVIDEKKHTLDKLKTVLLESTTDIRQNMSELEKRLNQSLIEAYNFGYEAGAKDATGVDIGKIENDLSDIEKRIYELRMSVVIKNER